LKQKCLKFYLLLILTAMMMFFTSHCFAQTPEKIFAPYVDVLLYPAFSINDAFEQTGQPYFTLAFITADTDCKPAWGGVIAMEDNYYLNEINTLRQKGGDVIISFGGANGTEPAMCHSDVDALQADYQSVIDRYQVSWVDFDIEGWAVGDRASIDLRNKAIKGLQEANPELTVAFCLPVLPSGLTHDGLYVLENALANGVRVDVVNVMAMDYGDWAAPNPEGNMGQYAMDAAVNTYQQALGLGLNPLMGVTPMIGQNDVASERFYLSDAEELLSWAETTDWVAMLSMWSAGRDNGGCGDKIWADPTCSGLTQTDFAFTDIFTAFNNGGTGNLHPQTVITSPLEGDTFEPGEPVILSADATDPDGTVVQVAFFSQDNPLGVVSDAPYTLSWNDVPAGVHVISAMATDDQGATGRSASIKITVGGSTSLATWDPSQIYLNGDEVCHKGKTWQAKWWTQGEEPGTTGQWGVWKLMGWCDGNTAPTATIVSPVDGDVMNPGDTVTLTAKAWDNDGTVVQVEFFVDGASIGVDQNFPYALSWEDVPEGTYSITVVATDDQGATGQSAAIRISVGENVPPSTLPWSASEIYWGGDQVSHNTKVWRAKWWTRGEEPGTTGQWGVWEEVF
jgi:chitodextrinase